MKIRACKKTIIGRCYQRLKIKTEALSTVKRFLISAPSMLFVNIAIAVALITALATKINDLFAQFLLDILDT